MSDYGRPSFFRRAKPVDVHLLAAVERAITPAIPPNEISPPIEYPIRPRNTESHMSSITGASHLSASIKDKINAAKARMQAVATGTDAALAKLNDAADTADKVSKTIEAEADQLLAEIGQFTNGAPE